MAKRPREGFWGYREVLATRHTPDGVEELVEAVHTTRRRRARAWRAVGQEPEGLPWVEADDGLAGWPPTHRLLSVPELRARGWTPALIRQFLGAPDGERDNPHGRAAAPMRLYLQSRVDAAQQEPAFQQALARAQHRQASAQAVVDRKREALAAWVDGLTIQVPLLEAEVLLQRACAHYNRAEHVPDGVLERQARQGADRLRATPKSDPAFLARITVNYLRHQCTTYEQLLMQTLGHVGVEAAAAAIRQKVLAAIAAQYPPLGAECARQSAAR